MVQGGRGRVQEAGEGTKGCADRPVKGQEGQSNDKVVRGVYRGQGGI